MSNYLPRDILLRERWSKDDLARTSVEYVDRGAPAERSVLSGASISHIGRSFLEIDDDKMIPFHRLTRIFFGDECIWERSITGGH
ncbi:MAG: DUF504 domain-containing protein [Candidatus Thermoplasmatota archaeon]|nr:DUF504 domain-containing protein [Candidatus Thermoplasmatota archaeon]